MKHRQTMKYMASFGIVFLAWTGLAHANPADAKREALREKNKQLAEQLEQQAAEIATLKAALQKRDDTIANLKQGQQESVPLPRTFNTPKLAIRKPFDEITISLEEGKAFQGTYIQLLSSRFNETEAGNLEFVFKKHGSKVVREDNFDSYSADRLTQKYKTEIRYETADPRGLATCNLIKRILEERYGSTVPIIHDSQYTYNGNRRYVEVYICEDLAGQIEEFKGKKLPLRFW